jgi:hypothetical protein
MQELAKSFSELVNSLNGGAKGLADALNRVAPGAWKVVVYQARLSGITNALCWLSLSCVLAFVARRFYVDHRKTLKLAHLETKKDAIGRLENEASRYYVVALACGSIAAAIAAVGVLSNVATILNPEYTAASELSARFFRR